jgi:hypothetical protein
VTWQLKTKSTIDSSSSRQNPYRDVTCVKPKPTPTYLQSQPTCLPCFAAQLLLYTHTHTHTHTYTHTNKHECSKMCKKHPQRPTTNAPQQASTCVKRQLAAADLSWTPAADLSWTPARPPVICCQHKTTSTAATSQAAGAATGSLAQQTMTKLQNPEVCPVLAHY